jgi:hypothetical protein
MNAYGRQIAQQQKAQALQAEKEAKSAEKYNEELADIMASYKTTGARDIDIPEITAAYNQIKEYNSQANKIKDSERPLFKATIKNMMNTVNETSLRSKELEGRTYTIASTVAQNPWDYDSKVIQDLDYIKKTPISKLGAMSNVSPLDYQRLPNFETINNIYKDTYGIGEKNSKFIEELREGGKRRNLSRVGEDVIKTDLIQRFTNSPEATKAISYRYSKQFGKQPTNEDLTNYIMDEYKAKYGLDYLGEIKDLEKTGGGKGAGDEQDKYTYRQQIIQGALNNDPTFINKMKAALPTGTKIEPLVSVSGKNGAKGGYKSLKITLPSFIDNQGNAVQGTTEVIEASRGEGAIKLNRILNTYTGEKISDSKLGISGGRAAGKLYKPKVTTPNSKENKPDVIQNGYTYRWNGTKYVPVK